MIAPLQTGEYVHAIAELGYMDDAEATQAIQHREGMSAYIDGVEFQNFRPAAWQQGWLDARELGEIGPLVFLRMDAEV